MTTTVGHYYIILHFDTLVDVYKQSRLYKSLLEKKSYRRLTKSRLFECGFTPIRYLFLKSLAVNFYQILVL